MKKLMLLSFLALVLTSVLLVPQEIMAIPRGSQATQSPLPPPQTGTVASTFSWLNHETVRSSDNSLYTNPAPNSTDFTYAGPASSNGCPANFLKFTGGYNSYYLHADNNTPTRNTATYTYFQPSTNPGTTNCQVYEVKNVTIGAPANYDVIFVWEDATTITRKGFGRNDGVGGVESFKSNDAGVTFVEANGKNGCFDTFKPSTNGSTASYIEAHPPNDGNTEWPEAYLPSSGSYQNNSGDFVIAQNNHGPTGIDHATSSCTFMKAQTIVVGQLINKSKASGTGLQNAGSSGNTECDGGGLTYIICPIVLGAAATVDGLRSLLQALLHVQPLTTNKTGNSIYSIWANIRNFADVIFVLVFLVVIFGTTLGLDNYAVKKTLPRLVAAAILVQLSYFITAFAIDIGNVLGGGIEALANGAGIKPPLFDFTSTGGTLATIFVGGLLIAGAAIALTFTAIISAFIAMLVLIMTLEIRQVIIILLIILSPLAMVAWVLPNTDKLFKLWYKSLFQLIIIYPIIMLLFIGGRLFATVVQSVPDIPFAPALAVIAYVAPLLMVPAVFKASGTLFNMASKGVGSIGQRAEKSFGAGSAGDKRRTENRVAEQAPNALNAKNPLSRAIASKKAGFGYLPSSNQKTLMAGVVKKQDAAALERADTELSSLDNHDLLGAALSAGASGDRVKERAATARLAANGATGNLDELLKSSYGGDANNPAWQKAIGPKAGELAKVAPHLTMGENDAAEAYNAMSAEQVAGLSDVGFRRWSGVDGGKGANVEQMLSIGQQIASSPPLQSKTNGERRSIINRNAGTSIGRGDYVPSPQETAIGVAQTEANDMNKDFNTAAAARAAGATTSSSSVPTTPPSTSTPAPVFTPLASHPSIPMVDPMSQGEVKIPGDDRSVS